MTMTWRQVQQTFNRRGHKISKRQSQEVVRRLPTACVAMGRDEQWVLRTVTRNMPGALERLLVLRPADDGS
jgi:hypothetical protein